MAPRQKHNGSRKLPLNDYKTTLRMPADLMKRAEDLATARQMYLSDVIRRLLEGYATGMPVAVMTPEGPRGIAGL